jgi:hypothetical protein
VKLKIVIIVVCVAILGVGAFFAQRYAFDERGENPQLASTSDHGVHLGPGDPELRRGERLVTTNGRYELVVEKGAVTQYADEKIVWSTMTDDVVRFVMQDDCNLVAYRVGGKASWSSDTAGRASDCTLRLQESDGNLVVVAPGNVPVWSRP